MPNDEHHVHAPTFGAATAVRKGTQPSRVNKQPGLTTEGLVLITGTAHAELAKEISTLVDKPLTRASISRFADGEVSIQIEDSIRGTDVFIVQPCTSPVNDSIMELLLTVSCARRSGAKRVIAVVPYYGYKHHRRGSSLSTKLQSRFLSSGAMDFARMLQEMGVDRVIAVDLQRPGQGQEACFFDSSVPLEVVLSTDIMIDYVVRMMELDGQDAQADAVVAPIVVVTPNAECFKKARKFQVGLQRHSRAEVQLAAFFSSDTGSGPTDVTKLELVGNDVKLVGADVVIVDDMVDTGGTLADLSKRLKAAGARRIFVAASHGIFTKNSMANIDDSPVDRVIVTNSLPLPALCSPKVVQVSLAPYLSNIILAEYFRTMSTAVEEEFRQEVEGDGEEKEGDEEE